MKQTLDSKPETPETEVVEPTELAVVKSSVGLAIFGGVDAMKAKMQARQEMQTIVLEYIDKNFIEGVDYGWTDERAKDKKTLKKPGSEKVCRLFNTRPTWRKDEDTWEMLGRPAGVICYICEIVDNSTGEIIGEGRGAEKVGNKSRDANKSIKIAEKCALVDAALYTFCLSEVFTQDHITPANDNEIAPLEDRKSELLAWVLSKRQGGESSLSDRQFIVEISKQVIHKKTIGTHGELDFVIKALTDGRFDWATAERLPE